MRIRARPLAVAVVASCVVAPALLAQSATLLRRDVAPRPERAWLLSPGAAAFAPARTAPVARILPADDLRAVAREAAVEHGHLVLHADDAAYDLVRGRTVADDEDDDGESRASSVGSRGGVGMLSVLGALAGGGAVWAAVSASQGAAAAPVSQAASSAPPPSGAALGGVASTPIVGTPITNPEPSTYVLMATGLAALAWWRRRTMRAA